MTSALIAFMVGVGIIIWWMYVDDEDNFLD
jgi:hypothetical protein